MPDATKLSFIDILKLSRGDLIRGISSDPNLNKNKVIKKIDILYGSTPKDIIVGALLNPKNFSLSDQKYITTKSDTRIILLPQNYSPTIYYWPHALVAFKENCCVGLFIGNIIRDSEFGTRINIMTFNGLNIWLEC